MTTQAQAAAAPAAYHDSGGSIPMLRTLGGLALLSGCLLSLVYQGTSERIARNFEARVRDAVFELLPGATQQKVFEFSGPDETGKDTPFTAYAGYDDTGRLVGVALEASDGNGYGGEIRFMYGYLPDTQQVVGMKVLLCKETPGLGDRIKSDEAFQNNFKALEVPLTDDGATLAHPLAYAKPGKGGGPGQIEGISGATISSKAVARAMHGSASLMLPAIRKHLSEMQENRP
ncbi:MAG TPA: FMN-binding protein [Candidatus Hydrogenedentes bacterium]|nr:FMN-binding protein [Candidatus Hydrogenedentota bacterium]